MRVFIISDTTLSDFLFASIIKQQQYLQMDYDGWIEDCISSFNQLILRDNLHKVIEYSLIDIIIIIMSTVYYIHSLGYNCEIWTSVNKKQIDKMETSG